MMRHTFLLSSFLLSLAACASQAICPPWTPTGTTAAAAPTEAPPDDDGTVALAGPSNDEAWNAVVGTKVTTAGAAHADHAAVKSDAVARAPKARKPRAAAAEPAQAVAQAGEKPAAPAAPAAQTPPAGDSMRKEARAFYAGRCVPCHGESGRGDGPTGKVLTPTPRNFTDRAWQRSVSDAHIEKVILNGGASIGKSPLMPAHGDLGSNKELLAAMRRLVRGFGS